MDRLFRLQENGTNVRTELMAGLTTFMTMAYIILVNPQILSNTKMDSGAVFTATIIATVVATLMMAFIANVPYAQAPGMGMNAFFTFTVCLGLGYTWQNALALVLISGIVNTIITVTQVRKAIIKAIPTTLQHAISGGIGLFIAYIGFMDAHLMNFTPNSKADVTGAFANVVPAIVNFKDKASVLALIGIVIIAVLLILKVKGAILWGILATTIIGIPMGLTQYVPRSFLPPSIEPTFFKLTFDGLFTNLSTTFLTLTTILAFVLSDIFDCIGTFLGTGRKAGIFDENDEKKEASAGKGKLFASRLDRALFSDLTATMVGSVVGTSNTTTYVESAAGISVGGRTGLTSLTVAVLFLACLFVSPVALAVPAAATAPALIIVGILMMSSFAKIKWDELEEAIPAFFTAVVMPFTYSISNGLAAGFIFYVIAKVAKGKWKEIHVILYIVAALFIVRFLVDALR